MTMETKNQAEKKEKKPVSPEKERTFIYTLARIVACIGNHTIFPVRYHGKENFDLKAPYIAMSNHNSALDPLILAYPCKHYEFRFVGKKELVKVKWIGNLLNNGLHMITVDRHNSDLAAMRLCVKTLRNSLGLDWMYTGRIGTLARRASTAAPVSTSLIRSLWCRVPSGKIPST